MIATIKCAIAYFIVAIGLGGLIEACETQSVQAQALFRRGIGADHCARLGDGDSMDADGGPVAGGSLAAGASLEQPD